MTRELSDVREVEDFLIRRVSEYAGLSSDEIQPDERFVNFGLGSKEAVLLSGDVSEWLGRDVSPTLVWEYPTIAQMAEYLFRYSTAVI
jgi:acyl carrier protein